MAEHASPDISGETSAKGRSGLETPLLKIYVGYRVGAAYPTVIGAHGPQPHKHGEVHDEDQNPGLSFTPVTTIPNTPKTVEIAQASQAKARDRKRSECPVGLENYTSVEYICTADENTFYHPETPAWSADQNPQGPVVLPRRFSDPAFNSMNEYWGITDEMTLGNGRPLGVIGQVEISDRESEPYYLDDKREMLEDDSALETERFSKEKEIEDPFEYEALLRNDEKDVTVNPFADEEETLFETDSPAGPFDDDKDDANPFEDEISSGDAVVR